MNTVVACRWVVLLFLAACTPVRGCGAQVASDRSLAGRVVIFDASHDQVYGPLDRSPSGYAIAADALREAGATVAETHTTLTEMLPSLDAPSAVVVLGVAMHERYNAGEFAALDAFMRGGGGVLALVEHDDLFANAQFQNELSGRYGITVEQPSIAPDTAANTPTELWVPVRSERLRVPRATFYLSPSLKVSEPAVALARAAESYARERPIVGAFAAVGAGAIAVLADAEFIWNGGPKWGARSPGNLQLFLRTIALLGAGGAAPAPVSPGPTPTTLSVYLTQDSSLGLDTGPSGLSRLATELERRGIHLRTGGTAAADDVLLVVAPGVLMHDTRMRVASQRSILVGSGETDPRGTSREELQLFQSFIAPDIWQSELSELAFATGVRFAPATLVSSVRPHLESAAEMASGARFAMHRATHLELSGSEWTVLARADSRSWPTSSLTPKQEFGAARQAQLPWSRPSEMPHLGPVVLAKTPRVLACSFAFSLVNESASSPRRGELVDLLADFIRSPPPPQ